MNEYWLVIRRRKLLTLACVAGGLLLAVTLNELSTPVFRSSVRIEVEREETRSPITGAVTESPTTQSDNQALFTTAQLVTSRTPMSQVAAALEAKGTALEAPARLPWAKNPPPGQDALSDRSARTDWLLAHVTVEPLRDTRLIRISVEHSRPAVAAEIANTIAENFVRYHMSQHSEADHSVSVYLRSQAEEVKEKIQALERQTGGSTEPGLFSLDSRIQQLTATASELNASYGKATTDRLSLSSHIDLIQRLARESSVDRDELPIHTEALDALRRDLLVSNTALAKAREIYGSDHPKRLLLESENADLRRNLRLGIENAIADLKSQRSIVSGREENLRSALAQVQAELRSLNEQSRAYSLVENDLKGNRDLYNMLMSRVHEAEIAGQLTLPRVRIVEPASLELRAVRPRKALNLAIGLLLGALAGAGLAFLSESFRKTIRTPQDAEEALHLPVLGLIPKDALR